jgi:hypothetical protein
MQRRKGKEKQISRRRFLKKSAIALGTVAVCDFEGMAMLGRSLALRICQVKN